MRDTPLMMTHGTAAEGCRIASPVVPPALGPHAPHPPPSTCRCPPDDSLYSLHCTARTRYGTPQTLHVDSCTGADALVPLLRHLQGVRVSEGWGGWAVGYGTAVPGNLRPKRTGSESYERIGSC